MAIASALPSLLTATAAPAVPWLSLNVTIVDNDRGASPSSYRARALGAGAQEVPPGTVHVIKQCFSVKMWPCQASFWSRWHDPVLGRWLGLTPEQPAHFLRGFPECPRAAPSRVGDPPGLGRRGGAQGAARGAIREKALQSVPPWGALYPRPVPDLEVCQGPRLQMTSTGWSDSSYDTVVRAPMEASLSPADLSLCA